MRLKILEQGHTRTQKIFLSLIGRKMGHVPGPIKVLTYRRSWFGSAFVDCLTRHMRQTSEWNKSEVELFAAFVSKLNQCVY